MPYDSYRTDPHIRLVVLMVEVEQPEGISARKLILETARHNVLTAYDGNTAVKLLERFPNVDLAVLHTELEGEPFSRTVRRLREIRSDLYIVAITPISHVRLDGVDKVLNSHEPQQLLDFLASEFHVSSSDAER
jgi:CheY-like chemotaxis protein